MSLFQFYSRIALLTFLLILLMWVFLLTVPFGSHTSWIILWGLTTFYPFALLAWSAYKIHRIMLHAKENHIDVINLQIQNCLGRIQRDPLKENLESLDVLLDVQRKVSNELDWPIDFESISALLITFLIPGINFFITLWRMFSK
jgi:hypothetical protein